MPAGAGGRDEAPEVGQRPEGRLDGGVPPVLAADRPRAAGVTGGRDQRVVPALALGVADRVDRREVDDVEAHRPDVVEPRDAVVPGAVPAGDPTLRAREQLVPGGEARRLAIDDHLQLPVVAGSGACGAASAPSARRATAPARPARAPAIGPGPPSAAAAASRVSRSAPAARDAASRTRAAPSPSSLSTSWPAWTRRSRSRAHEANRSVHASIV